MRGYPLLVKGRLVAQHKAGLDKQLMTSYSTPLNGHLPRADEASSVNVSRIVSLLFPDKLCRSLAREGVTSCNIAGFSGIIRRSRNSVRKFKQTYSLYFPCL